MIYTITALLNILSEYEQGKECKVFGNLCYSNSNNSDELLIKKEEIEHIKDLDTTFYTYYKIKNSSYFLCILSYDAEFEAFRNVVLIHKDSINSDNFKTLTNRGVIGLIHNTYEEDIDNFGETEIYLGRD